MGCTEYLEGFGQAGECEAAGYHSPKPCGYVWLHIQPSEAGGKTAAENLAQLCRNCAHGVRVLLSQIAGDGLTVSHPNPGQLALAREGYQACLEAGTVGDIPKTL